MDKTRFYLELADVVDSPADAIRGDTALAALEGWDSLAVLAFIAMVDNVYGVAMPSAEVARSRTVDDLAAAVLAHVGAQKAG
jgi:acyl carrier protein